MNSAAKACLTHLKFGLRFDSSVVFLFLISSLRLNYCGETASGRGSPGSAAYGHALVAGNDAVTHGASIHHVRADVQRTHATERKGSQLCSAVLDHLTISCEYRVGLVVLTLVLG